jgi:hypothetical protein
MAARNVVRHHARAILLVSRGTSKLKGSNGISAIQDTIAGGFLTIDSDIELLIYGSLLTLKTT